MRKPALKLLLCLLYGTAPGTFGWPIDGYPDTGIRRLEEQRLIAAGEMEGTGQPPGGRWPTRAVDIRLAQREANDLPTPDEPLTTAIRNLLGEQAAHYGIAVLDLTEPHRPVYAEHRGDYRLNVGSVGKLLAALGYFQALADAYPQDIDRREALLRNSTITADRFALTDHHNIRLFDTEQRRMTRRPMREGDVGTIWEYLDWALSASSNAAASMLMRDAMLLRHLGRDYPPTEQAARHFFDDMPPSEGTRLFQATFWEPVTRNGLSLEAIRQGSFFTREGKRLVAGGGLSYASPRSLMQLLLAMEQGDLVDAWSSRALKRLLYMTERRIRYASSPALDESAVYFKSGSLYSCEPEEGFTCGQYRGNRYNYMTSVAIVETEIKGRRVHYLVTLISNVLRENSALAHQSLGTQIHELMLARHFGQGPGDSPSGH